MNPNAAVFCPKPSSESKSTNVNPDTNNINDNNVHHDVQHLQSPSSSSSQLSNLSLTPTSLEYLQQGTIGNDPASPKRNVRIKQNIPNNQINNNNHQINTQHNYNMSNIQQQQYITLQMQQLTISLQDIHTRVNDVLQPQLNSLNQQMQYALFNCVHIVNPDYVNQLQSQQLTLKQQIQLKQKEYQSLTLQYQYYQSLINQSQAQAHAQAQAQAQAQVTAAVATQSYINGYNGMQQHITTTQQQHPQAQHSHSHSNGNIQQYNNTQQQTQQQQQQLVLQHQQHNNNNYLISNLNMMNMMGNIPVSATHNMYTESLVQNRMNRMNRMNMNMNSIAFDKNAMDNIGSIGSSSGLKLLNKTKYNYTNREDLFERKLCGLICKLSPERYDKILTKMLEFISNYVRSRCELKIIIEKLLKFTLNQATYFYKLTAELFLHFSDYVPRLKYLNKYIFNEDEIKLNKYNLRRIFRELIIISCQSLFNQYKTRNSSSSSSKSMNSNSNSSQSQSQSQSHSHSNDTGSGSGSGSDCNKKQRRQFLSLMEIIGELYNVDLIHHRLIRRGIFDYLLPPKNLIFTSTDVDGICRLLKISGKKLDYKYPHYVNKYINKLLKYSDNLEFKTKLLIDEVTAMRSNNWVIQRIQKYKISKSLSTLDQIREHKEEHNYNDDDDDALTLERITPSPRYSDISFAVKSSSPQIMYKTNSNLNGLEECPFKNGGNISHMATGYNDSNYILNSSHKLLVAGDNGFGQLGILDELIRDLIINLYKKNNSYNMCSEMSSDIIRIITKYVSSISYKGAASLQQYRLISSPDMSSINYISSGLCSRHRFVLCGPYNNSRSSHRLYGTGYNQFNQLGISSYGLSESRDEHYYNNWIPISYFRSNNISLREICCGYTSSTFLSLSGDIYICGYSSFGNLGIGNKSIYLNKITKIYTIKTRIQHISMGLDHTLCINEFRNVLSFGDNEYGQLGLGHDLRNRKQKPKEIEYFIKNNIHAIKIDCGLYFSSVLDCNGHIYSFGYNYGYQCYYNKYIKNNKNKITFPTLNEHLHHLNIINIKCGGFHQIAETKKNIFYLWGDNSNKQCAVYMKSDKSDISDKSDDNNDLKYIKIPKKFKHNKLNQKVCAMFPGLYDTRIIANTVHES